MAKRERAEYEIGLKDKLSNPLSRANSNANKFDRTMGRVGRSTRKSSSALSSIGKFAGFATLALGAFTLGKFLVKNGVEIEQNRIAFETLTGSAEKGNKVFSDLTKFANVTPFETRGVQKAGRTLLGFGVETKALLPTLKVLGDVSAGTGKDLSELGVIYGQIKGAGRLMGQDLLQLINAGFNPLQAISEKTGESMGKLKKRMSAGGISFGEVQQAFIDVTSEGGRFNNLMEKQSRSLGGLWSTLVGKITNNLGLLAEKGTGFLGGLVSGAIEVVDFFSNEWFAIKLAFEPLIELFGEVSSEMAVLFGTVGEGVTVTSVLKSVFNGIGNTIRFLMPLIRSSVNRFISMFKAIKKVSVAVIEWYESSERAQKTFKVLTSSVVAGFVFISESATALLSPLGDILTGIFTLDKDKLFKGFEQLEQGLKDAGKSSAEAFNESFNTRGTDLFKFDTSKKEEGLNFGDLSDFKDKSLLSGSGTGKGKKESSTSVDGVSSGRPTSINIDIEKLVENFTVTMTDSTDSFETIRDMVSKALVTAVNDVNLIARG